MSQATLLMEKMLIADFGRRLCSHGSHWSIWSHWRWWQQQPPSSPSGWHVSRCFYYSSTRRTRTMFFIVIGRPFQWQWTSLNCWLGHAVWLFYHGLEQQKEKNTTSNHFSKADNTSETTMALTSLGYRKDKVNVDQLDWATDNTNNNHKPLSSSSVDNDMKEFLVNPLSKVRSSSISSLNVWAPSNNNNYQQDWFTESASMVVPMPTCISPMHLTFMSQEQQTHWAWQLMIIIWPFKLVQLLMF